MSRYSKSGPKNRTVFSRRVAHYVLSLPAGASCFGAEVSRVLGASPGQAGQALVRFENAGWLTSERETDFDIRDGHPRRFFRLVPSKRPEMAQFAGDPV